MRSTGSHDEANAGPASIADVARVAGVSEATVSRALRGLPNVAVATRARVMDAAAELAYVASPSASRLASGRTMTVALAAPYLDRWYAGRVLAGVEASLSEADFDLLIAPVTGPSGRQGFIDRLPALRRRVDGLILLDWFVKPREIGAVQRAGPAVTVGERHDAISSVSVDNTAAERTATEHLLEMGHRRLATITGIGDENASPVASDRLLGFRLALEAADVDPDSAVEAKADFTVAGGERAMHELLARPGPHPTAVVVQSDEMAFGALGAARRAGVDVPEALSVVGFDGHDLGAAFGLTTMTQPLAAMGSDAVRMLLAELDESAGVAQLRRECSLEIRATTAPPG